MANATGRAIDVQGLSHRDICLARGAGRGIKTRRAEARRILSSTLGSEPLGKFSTLLDFSTVYQRADSHRHDPICRVLNMELLQFYYSRMVSFAQGWIAAAVAKGADVAPRTGAANIPVADSAEQPEKIIKIRFVATNFGCETGD